MQLVDLISQGTQRTKCKITELIIIKNVEYFIIRALSFGRTLIQFYCASLILRLMLILYLDPQVVASRLSFERENYKDTKTGENPQESPFVPQDLYLNSSYNTFAKSDVLFIL